MKQPKINFEKFCKLIKKYVYIMPDVNELNDLYISYKEAIRGYYFTPTEWIIMAFELRTIKIHGNCLKRNKNKNGNEG